MSFCFYSFAQNNTKCSASSSCCQEFEEWVRKNKFWKFLWPPPTGCQTSTGLLISLKNKIWYAEGFFSFFLFLSCSLIVRWRSKFPERWINNGNLRSVTFAERLLNQPPQKKSSFPDFRFWPCKTMRAEPAATAAAWHENVSSGCYCTGADRASFQHPVAVWHWWKMQHASITTALPYRLLDLLSDDYQMLT